MLGKVKELMNRLEIFLDGRNVLRVVFILLFLFSIIVQWHINIVEYKYFDRYLYWSIAESMTWHVTNACTNFRGVYFPFLLWCSKAVGELFFGKGYVGYRLLSSIVYAWVFSYGIGHILDKVINLNNIKKLITLLLCGLYFFYIFYGVVVNPLSDMYAYALVLLLIIVLDWCLKNLENVSCIKLSSSFFIMGGIMYILYNVRTIHLFTVVVVGIVLAVEFTKFIKKEYIFRLFTATVAVILGFLFFSIPQYRQNKAFGTPSLAVQTDNLFLFQLEYGLKYSRYDTYANLNEDADYSFGAVVWKDAQGEELIAKEGYIVGESSYLDFFKMIAKHPFISCGVYTRHVLNMLYTFYPSIYIEKMGNNKLLYMISFWFLFISMILYIKKIGIKRNLYKYLGIMLAACVVILPGAVEYRFFISMHVIIALFGLVGMPHLCRSLKNNRFFILVLLGSFMIYYAYAGFMMTTLVGPSVAL